MTDKVPDYIYKLAITDEIIAKSMVKLLEDFNVYLDEEKALKLLYSILAHFMYKLDTNPGNYFKLKFVDIVSDKDNFIAVRRGSEYTDDTVTPTMFYEKFCGTQMLKEELEKSVDLFAKSFLGMAEEKVKEKRNLDNLIAQRKRTAEDIDNFRKNARCSKKQRQNIIKKRKADAKTLRAEANRKYKSCFSTQLEIQHREKFLEQRKELEAELQQLWETDKEKFEF